METPPQALNLGRLTIPKGYDFVLVCRSPEENKGFLEMHLQTIQGAEVTRCESTKVRLWELGSQPDQTATLQHIINRLYEKAKAQSIIHRLS